MPKRKPVPVTGIFLAIIVLFIGIDTVFIETDVFPETSADSIAETETRTEPIDEPVIDPKQPDTPKMPIGGVQKSSGPDVLDVLVRSGYALADTKESALLSQIIPPDVSPVHAHVLMKDNDRVGLLAWSESLDVKIYFLALKEALHATFSPQMRDLVDETQHREFKPPRNLLTFLDPAISQERIVFVRVRERLYEFHVAPGKDEEIFEIVEALTE